MEFTFFKIKFICKSFLNSLALKVHILKYFLLICSIVLFSACNSAKKYNEHRLSKISPEKLHQDIDFTHRKLQEMHPKLYWYISKEALAYKFDSLKTTINKPLTPVEFYFKMQPVIAQIREGHLSMRIPGKRISKKEIKKFKKTKGLFSRFEYLVQDDHLYFVENKDSIAGIEAGTELLSINDIPVREYLKRYQQLIGSDGYNTTFQPYYMKDVFFNFLVAEKGIMDSAKIKTIYDDIEKTFTLKRESKNEQEIENEKADKKKTQEKKLNDYVAATHSYNRSLQFLDKDSSIAYIKIKSFSESFSSKFYKESFAKIKKSGADYLIIDIRNNYGGSLREINNLYSYLAPEPFVLIKPAQLVSTGTPLKTNYFRKASPLQFAMKSIGYPGYFFYQTFSSYKGKDGIAYYKMKENRSTKPKDDVFKGKIYVLINGGSFSASSIISSKLKFDQRATLVGEETGGANDGTVAGFYSYQKLPHSKIELPIGLLLVQPNIDFGETSLGVTPHVEVLESVQNVIDKEDVQMEWVKGDIKILKGKNVEK